MHPYTRQKPKNNKNNCSRRGKNVKTNGKSKTLKQKKTHVKETQKYNEIKN